MKVAEYERMHAAEERQWWYAGMRAISRAVLDSALKMGGRVRLLDAGCGTGGNLSLLQRYGWVVGVDLADEALARARERGSPLVRADLGALPFADETLDGVASFDVFYHLWVSDDGAAVREIARVLRPGGWLFVRLPALEWLRGAHDEEVLTRRRYTRSEVCRLLSEGGLVVVRSSYCNALLFPLIALRRIADRLFRRQGSDVEFLPRPFEALFRGALRMEAFWLAWHSLPIGSSVIALARRPEIPRGALGPVRINGRRESSDGERA